MLGGALLAGLAVGVGIDVLRTGGLEAWQAARGAAFVPTTPPYDARGVMVQVDGRGVYVDCRGSGAPTVLLEAGFGSGANGWGEALDGIAAFTRVCAWDRPGNGRSEARGRHSAADVAADFRAALEAAGERGPFILVGHSLGGVYVRVFAEGPGARDDVLSYLFLDSYDPDLGMVDDPTIPAEARERIRASLAQAGPMFEAGEDLDWARTLQELAVVGPIDLPAIRITVEPRGRFPDPDPSVVDLLVAAWERAVARTFPTSVNEIAEGSGHMIQFDRPDLVIDRTRQLVERARAEAGPSGQRSP